MPLGTDPSTPLPNVEENSCTFNLWFRLSLAGSHLNTGVSVYTPSLLTQRAAHYPTLMLVDIEKSCTFYPSLTLSLASSRLNMGEFFSMSGMMTNLVCVCHGEENGMQKINTHETVGEWK